MILSTKPNVAIVPPEITRAVATTSSSKAKGCIESAGEEEEEEEDIAVELAITEVWNKEMG